MKKIDTREINGAIHRKIAGKSPVVFSDLDKTLRWDKDEVSCAVQEAILEFVQKNGVFIVITGAPACHIPTFLRADMAFAESGAVFLIDSEEICLAPMDGVDAIHALEGAMGIKARDGPGQLADGRTVIIEGPRLAVLTLVAGTHKDYPGATGEVPIEELEKIVRDIIAKKDPPIFVSRGRCETYDWMDITTGFKKEHAVEWFLQAAKREACYFMGDGRNDYAAMSLPSVTPVGFSNSDLVVQESVRARNGILVERAGPDGGVIDALNEIIRRTKKQKIRGG